MGTTLHLYRLQQIDSRLKQVNTRLNVIDSILNNNAEMKAAVQRLKDAEGDLVLAEKALKNAEFQAGNQRIKLENVESTLYNSRIQNPKELQDLQKDIAALKRNLDSLENEQLAQMMAVETSNQNLETARKEHEATLGKVIGENASLKSEQTNLQKELENLHSQRSAVLPVIKSDFLNLYESLRQKRSGLAVAQVIENACDACGSSLTPGLAQSVRTSNQLILCPMCGRILYSN